MENDLKSIKSILKELNSKKNIIETKLSSIKRENNRTYQEMKEIQQNPLFEKSISQTSHSDLLDKQNFLSQKQIEKNNLEMTLKENDLKLDVLKFELSKYLKSINHSKGTLFSLFKLKESSKEYLLPLSIICYDLSVFITNSSKDVSKILEREQNLIIWSMDRIEKNQFYDKIENLKSQLEKYSLIYPLDLIEFNDSFLNIFTRCFGSFVITKNDQISIEILEKYNISSITILGTIHQKGVIKGGFRNQNSNPLLKKKYLYQDCLNEKEKLIQEIQRLNQEIQEIKNENLKRIQVEKENEMILELRNRFENCRESYQKNHEFIQELEREYEEIKLNLKINQHKEKEISNEINNINSKEWIKESLKKKKENLLKYKSVLIEQEKSIERLQDLIDKNQDELEKYQNNYQNQELELKRLSLEIEKVNQAHQHQKLKFDQLKIELELQKCKILKKQKEHEEITMKLLQKENRIKENEKNLKKLESCIHLEKKNLLKLEKEKEKIELNEDEIEKDEIIKEEIIFQMNQLSKEKGLLEKNLPNINYQEIKEKKEKINEFKEMLKYIESSIENLKNGIKKSQKIVDEFNEIAFKSINQNFQKIFKEMIPTKSCNLMKLGSKIEQGIDFEIKNSNETKCNYSELSGGQKTLLNISLILSISIFKKSLFYIIDGILKSFNFF